MLIERDVDIPLRYVLILGIILSDITKDALKLHTLQCLRKVGLAEKDVERVTEALMDLDASLDRIKGELRLIPAVYKTGDTLNKSVNGILEKMLVLGSTE